MGYMPNLFTKDLTCETCKGKCWVAGDNAATQANAMAAVVDVQIWLRPVERIQQELKLH